MGCIGCLEKRQSDLAIRLDVQPILEHEKNLFPYFCQVDLAHTVMLTEQNIISREVGGKLLSVLLEIRERGVEGFPIDPVNGTLFYQIEAFLTEKLGEQIAGSVHTARSRLDQSATAQRLFERQSILQVMKRTHDLQAIIIELAERHRDTIMPSYTHMQQAQPGNFCHYLLSFVDRLQDDFDRCREVLARVNRSPLGTVGLSGTGWPIDRQRTADLLGFEALVYNAKLGRDAQYAAEIVSCLSFIMSTVNELATDLHVWSTAEYAYVELDDGDCRTSSIFPQKKNPIVLERIRREAGLAVTWLASSLATFRGQGTGDHNIHSVPFLHSSLQTTSNMLQLATGVMEKLKIKGARMDELLAVSWATASNLADIIVRDHGLCFRQAHSIVAELFRICKHEHITRADVTMGVLQRASHAVLGRQIDMTQEKLYLALDPREFVRTRVSVGGVGPSEVEHMLQYCKKKIIKNRSTVLDLQRLLLEAASGLNIAASLISQQRICREDDLDV
jgi:argininosuccinate lyase